LAAGLALAACDAKAADCNNARSQMEMNACAGAEFDRADARLNATYRRAMARLDQNGKAKLRDPQRAWIKFRDAECSYRASASEGGSIYPLEVATCATDLTNRRIRALSQMP
jgi:uncharacterized protein YecT (DUF1311 family)